jgi:hypothetical protein
VERQTDSEHGAAIAEQLSKDLQAEFQGIGGFSRRNVFYMREFYLLYRHDERVQPLCEMRVNNASLLGLGVRQTIISIIVERSVPVGLTKDVCQFGKALNPYCSIRNA